MYCPGCGHHHRTHETKCQAIMHEPDDGGAHRCTCQHHTNQN